jgi:hypothetical protein
MTTYREAAATGFDLLATQYLTTEPIFYNDFWFAGNTLHTCLNYLIAAKEADGKAILQHAHELYHDLTDGREWWHDDYGWWGNAFAVAIENREALGYGGTQHDPLFRALLVDAHDCFEKLRSSWSDETYGGERDNADGSADITGGTFNLRDQPPMSGRNSVTNEVFWILSRHLSKLGGNPDYAKYAELEREWFGRWQAYAGGDGRKNGLFNGDGLVLERPLGNMSVPAWYWSGDQGLFMAANPFTTLAIDIAKAVEAHMTDGDKILHEWMGFLSDFTADYATGKGIFMRSAGQINLALKEPLFSDFIKKNGAAVWFNRVKEDDPGNQRVRNQFTFNWNPGHPVPGSEPEFLEGYKTPALCNLIMQTAGLEALTANLWLWPDDQVGSATGS